MQGFRNSVSQLLWAQKIKKYKNSKNTLLHPL